MYEFIDLFMNDADTFMWTIFMGLLVVTFIIVLIHIIVTLWKEW